MTQRIIPIALVFLTWGLFGQTPQTKLSYEDRSGTTGHTLLVDDKPFGPYKDVYSVAYSTSGTAGLFLVTKRDRLYVVAQGREFGPLNQGFDPEMTLISDDGKLWAVSTTRYDEEESDTGVSHLWVNGKTFGPFVSIQYFEYAEAGGNWIALVEQGEEEFSILLNGKTLGPFSSVDHVWMSPDGKAWGYVATDEEGTTSVVTQDKAYEGVSSYDFSMMYPRSLHWAFGFLLEGDEEVIVVDGKAYAGYRNFSGLHTTASGRHWGFEAEKLTDAGDFPIVVVNGKEYVGEGLAAASLGAKESFTWTIKDGNKVSVQVLSLP